MTQQKQTIMQAWQQAVEKMKQDCQRGGTHIWHAVQDRSHVVSNYRPDYDEWFGDGFMDVESTRSIVDVLDDHLMTLMELAAKDEIMNEFMTTAGGIYYCMRRNHSEYEFANEETRRAFTLFRAIKGYN
jgi:hypothetical protein